ncbi:MAG: hypothetical protein ABSE95_18995, partial [Thermodesulfobacteriota bacterium]
MKNVILVTGQSGVKVKKCLEKLEGKVISLEDTIEEQHKKQRFTEFLSLPQSYQYEYWKSAFNEIVKERINTDSQNTFLTFHAVYFHQQKSELFPPVDFKSLSALENKELRKKLKMIVILIDDIYDVYRRLIEEGQMFEDIIDKRMDPVDAIFVSIK